MDRLAILQPNRETAILSKLYQRLRGRDIVDLPGVVFSIPNQYVQRPDVVVGQHLYHQLGCLSIRHRVDVVSTLKEIEKIVSFFHHRQAIPGCT